MLTEGGEAELAYRVATNPTFPGWGYWFLTVHGSNLGSNNVIVDTMWESWNETARSQNHAFLGVVDDWLYQYVAGIKATAPAYREIQIKPYAVGALRHASARVTTPLGKVSSSWKRSGGRLELDVHIPVGATAKVLVPLDGGQTARAEGGRRPTKISDGYATFEVGAGDYTFHAVPR